MQEFNKILNSSKKILITSHIKPDWDAICSMLTMYDYLKKTYPDKIITPAISSSRDDLFKALKYFENLIWANDISEIINDFDTVIFLDGNSLGRFTNKNINLENTKTICFDHHPNPPDNFDFILIDLSEVSTSSLIYKTFFRENKDLLDEQISKVILTGIMGDTGTFRYVTSKNSDVLIYTKELLDISNTEIQNLQLPMTEMSEEELEVIKILLDNTFNLELPNTIPFTYSYIPMSALNNPYSLNVIKSAGEKYKSIFLRQIKNYTWGFVVTPDSEKDLYISFRSMPGSPNVRNLATLFPGGGGHVLASGVSIEVSKEIKESEDLCKLIIQKIENTQLEIV